VLILAFDTATDLATSALVDGEDVLGERFSAPKTMLEDVDALLRHAGLEPSDVDALAVGTGPGSFTGTRIGLAVARGIALATGVPAAGISTLDAIAAGAPEAFPVIDAKRGEVFVPGPRAIRPESLALEPGMLCVGSGARRYRDVLEAGGYAVPPDRDERHLVRACFLAALAGEFGPADAIEPLYVRAPDADKVLT
jgi:tRNA threonylcarbamoyl adenosine modification protein YeaZ